MTKAKQPTKLEAFSESGNVRAELRNGLIEIKSKDATDGDTVLISVPHSMAGPVAAVLDALKQG